MGRRKKYNFKGVLNTTPYKCFEFGEKIPINCWICKHKGSICRGSGTLTNRFCPQYTPNILDMEVRTLFEYIPKEEFNELLLDGWQK